MGIGFSGLFEDREERILLLGLEETGKYTICLNLIDPKIPFLFIGNGICHHKNLAIQIITPKSTAIRVLLHHYLIDLRGLVWVVDASERVQIEESRTELFRALEDCLVPNLKILVLANKQDLLNAMKADEIIFRLRLNSITNHTWHVQEASGITGEGVKEGFDWLVAALKQ